MNKNLTPITKSQIEFIVWVGGWALVKTPLNNIEKCEATRDNQWLSLESSQKFTIQEGQLYCEIAKPIKKKQW